MSLPTRAKTNNTSQTCIPGNLQISMPGKTGFFGFAVLRYVDDTPELGKFAS